MSKRAREDAPTEERPPAKRARFHFGPDRLSALSDEILLLVLSFLPIPSLITCQRLSRRFHILAGDSELWKRKYYNRWVWPRARRLRSQRMAVPPNVIDYSPKVSQWLDHGHLATTGADTSWKNRYRLRHNWSTGVCRVTEVEVAQPTIPPVLVKLENGVLFTADATKGLRAWHIKDTKTPFAQIPFTNESESEWEPTPTAITVTPNEKCRDSFKVVVGFENGRLAIYSLGGQFASRFTHRLTHQSSEDGSITALASSDRYLLVLAQNQVLSLYRLPEIADNDDESTLSSPQLMTSLQASNVHAPLSLSIRTVAREIIASIAYSFCRIGCGWSVGLQEVRLDEDGENLGSRLATTVDSQCARGTNHQSLPAAYRRNQSFGGPEKTTMTRREMDFSYALSAALSSPDPPTSLSYSHPYLLLSHSNNTLTMYLAVSTSDSLAIKSGRRLWGHTSAVASVQVSDRGKAVSVSAKGDDIRVWELENVVSVSLSSKRALRQDGSIRLAPERLQAGASPSEVKDVPVISQRGRGRGPGSTFDFAAASVHDGAMRMRGLVGFDEEQVVVHCEREAGSQMLGCYDFT